MKLIKIFAVFLSLYNLVLADYSKKIFEEKDPKGAIQELKELIKSKSWGDSNTQRSSIYRHLGYAYIIEGKLKLAQKAFDKSYGAYGVYNYHNEIKDLLRSYPKKVDLIKEGEKITDHVISVMKQWKDMGIPYLYIPDLQKAGKTPQDYKAYKNIRKEYQVKKLLEWDIKPTKLIVGMSYLDYTFFPCFRNEKEFKANLQLLKANNCKTMRNQLFSKADEYDNEGNCYLFNAELFQRFDRHTGLASGVSGGSTFNLRYYGNTIYVEFDKSWRENASHAGIIKGLGNFEYESSETTENVAKGKVIKFIQ